MTSEKLNIARNDEGFVVGTMGDKAAWTWVRSRV